MNLITDYNEFKAEYLGTRDWLKNYYNTPEKLEKEVIKSFKRYMIYKTQDGLTLTLDKKPVITSELLFDDEQDAPSTQEDNFIAYNMQLNFKHDMTDYKNAIKSLEERGCCSGCIELEPYFTINYTDNRVAVIPVFYNYNDRKTHDIARGSFVRDMTPEEVQEYFTICEELEANYIDRLKAYYKKYNKNITTRGYYANR